MTEPNAKTHPTDASPAANAAPTASAPTNAAPPNGVPMNADQPSPQDAAADTACAEHAACPSDSATTSSPTAPAAAQADSPQQDSPQVPPPASFKGSMGTGAINVGHTPDSTGAPEAANAPQHNAPEADSQAPARNRPATMAPLHMSTMPSPDGTSAAAGANPAPTTAPAAPPVKAGPAEHSFRLLSFFALFSLALILAVQQYTSIYIPSTFTMSELGFAGMYEHMLAANQWLVPPHLANMPAALPVYFWFMRLVDAIPYADGNFLYPLVSALSAFVALAGVYTLGLTTGLGNKVAFAAGLILLSCLGFTPLGHYLSPDLLFAGTLAFSMACLYRGWINQLSYVWLALGFALAGISTLTGGLMGLVIPLLTSLGFVVWRGSFRRGHQLDAVFGFALLLVVILGWLGAIILLTGESTYLYTLTRQIFAPFLVPLWPPQDPWWLYGLRLPVALLPWVLVILFVPWGCVCATAWPSLKASRNEKSGSAWLWIALFTGCLYVSATSIKPCLAFVPLLPFAALLLAKALLNLPEGRSRGFFLLLALGFAVVAVLLAALSLPFGLAAISPYIPAPIIKALESAQGLPVMAGVCALGALVLWKGTRRALPAGALLVTVLLATMLVQPASLMLSPSLMDVMGANQPEVTAPADTAPQTGNAAQDGPTAPEAAPQEAVPQEDGTKLTPPAESAAPTYKGTQADPAPITAPMAPASPAAPAEGTAPAPQEGAPAPQQAPAVPAPSAASDAPAAPEKPAEAPAVAPPAASAL